MTEQDLQRRYIINRESLYDFSKSDDYVYEIRTSNGGLLAGCMTVEDANVIVNFFRKLHEGSSYHAHTNVYFVKVR